MILFERISPLKIIKCHFKTLCDGSSDELNIWSEILPLMLVALGIAYLLPFQMGVLINANITPYILGGFSVAGGFLINSLMVLAEKRSDKTKIAAADRNNKLLKETFYNTSFGVLICLIATLASIIYPLSENHLWASVLSGLIYFLTALFFHTVMMVIKRLSKIFDPD